MFQKILLKQKYFINNHLQISLCNRNIKKNRENIENIIRKENIDRNNQTYKELYKKMRCKNSGNIKKMETKEEKMLKNEGNILKNK